MEIEPADAALLGTFNDGSAGDIWRLKKQEALVRQQGFEFFAGNGLLNLYQWWKDTDHALVPPHMIEMVPPLNINFDTNLLLKVRQAAQEAIDRRAVQHPDGSYHLVARLNHKVFVGKLDPIYGSIDAANDRHLLGVVIDERTVWWVDLLDDGRHSNFRTAFRLWEVVLNWVAVVMPAFLADLAPKKILRTIAFGMEAQWEGIERECDPTDDEIPDTIGLTFDVQNKRVKLSISPKWHWVLRRTDNIAELLLATRILQGAAKLFGIERPEAELAELARRAAGSADLRWMHSFIAQTALDGLASNGLRDFILFPSPREAWRSAGLFGSRALARPIVELSAEPDAELVFAPAVIERAMLHNMGGALSGALQNEFWQSDAMRKFSSSAGAAAGIAFNGRVAERLQQLQLRAWPSATPAWCLNQKATDELKALGDIDVLAVSPDGSCVWIVEAKDLKLCRTLGEAARRLSEYRGKLTQKGKPDKLLRHLNRVAYIRANSSALGARLGLKVRPRVCGVVVVRAPQPMEQLQTDVGVDGVFVMLSDMTKVPWATGWP